MRRVTFGAVALAAVLTAGPSPASAAVTVSRPDAATLRYEGDALSDIVLPSLVAGDTQVKFTLVGHPRADVTPVAPCVFEGAAPDPDVLCPRSGIAGVVLDLGDGNDAVTPSTAPPFPIALHMNGGSGDDSLTPGAGADDISGGTGIDRTSYCCTSSPVKVTLDDVANDGTAGGADGDNVRSDVEDVVGGHGDDELTGNTRGNMLDGSDGRDKLDGGGGGDELFLGAGDDVATARDGNPERIHCDAGEDSVVIDDIDESSGCEHVAASGELVRDLDRDGFANPDDCDDHDAAVHPSAADVPDDNVDQDCDGADAHRSDADGDGSPRPFDCDDASAAAHPGAAEVSGNSVDENCDGIAAPLQVVVTPVLSRFRIVKKGTEVQQLRVTDVEPGTHITARCTGKRCPLRAVDVPVPARGGTVDLRAVLRLKLLRGSGVLELRILRDDAIGRVVRLRFSSTKPVTREILCLRPAQTAPARC